MTLRLPTMGDQRRLKSLFSSATGLATVICIALKITGIITWSWWLVLGPLWMPFVAMIVLLIVSTVSDFLLDMLEFTAFDHEEDDDDDEWSPR